MLNHVAAVVVLVVIAAPPSASAHDGHAHVVMGTITGVADTYMEIKTPGGEVLKIALNPKTVVTRDKRKIGRAEVQTGRRVVVDIGNGEDPLIAREIRVGATRLDEKQEDQ